MRAGVSRNTFAFRATRPARACELVAEGDTFENLSELTRRLDQARELRVREPAPVRRRQSTRRRSRRRLAHPLPHLATPFVRVDRKRSRADGVRVGCLFRSEA